MEETKTAYIIFDTGNGFEIHEVRLSYTEPCGGIRFAYPGERIDTRFCPNGLWSKYLGDAVDKARRLKSFNAGQLRMKIKTLEKRLKSFEEAPDPTGVVEPTIQRERDCSPSWDEE